MFREDLSVNERALVVFSGRLEHLIHLHPELRAFSEALEQVGSPLEPSRSSRNDSSVAELTRRR